MTIRRVLDEAGGQAVRIISKIENEAGLEHLDDILRVRAGAWAGLAWASGAWGLGWRLLRLLLLMMASSPLPPQLSASH
jgi:hypothetical protein